MNLIYQNLLYYKLKQMYLKVIYFKKKKPIVINKTMYSMKQNQYFQSQQQFSEKSDVLFI